MKKRSVFFYLFLFISMVSSAQLMETKLVFTAADTLRGSLNPQRTWWNVLRYDIMVHPDFASRSIKGSNRITFSIVEPVRDMQIDLQQPMQIDSIIWNEQVPKTLSFTRTGNILLIQWPAIPPTMQETSITLYFSGKPLQASNPPWDGGWIWTSDEKGNPWISVACQGLGASVWYPCKDHQSDKPDRGATVTMIVPEQLTGVANGRLIEEKTILPNLRSFTWEVTNPINNYNLIPYIGRYAQFSDTLQGEKGVLDLNYWVMENHLSEARNHFKQTKKMLRTFEYWLGPYPFYEDSYKLVEAPHLGMEHQSAIAYGNKFMNGYVGIDMSESGWGLNWDYIIVHESGHEWFGNNITSKDLADMWIHEGFTTYTETLYTEYWFGKKAANEYNYGLRKSIKQDIPIIGSYGVNKEGSGDMYSKTANMLHTLRHALNDDSLFRKYLRGLNMQFYHSVADYATVLHQTETILKRPLAAVFEQYLKTTELPTLQFAIGQDKKTLYYRFTSCVSGFSLPIWIIHEGEQIELDVSEKQWKSKVFNKEISRESLQEIEKQYYCKWQLISKPTE
ncbi:MAG: M1 family peptidase [Chitinophagia bacterium]|nr:M1 family peptidase [Chitinophagia bacterium]